MRTAAFAFALLASGCFRWAPVTSLSSIEDERVVIEQGAQRRMLVHATARGREIEGQAVEGGEPVQLDATEGQVLVRKLNVPGTAAIIGASALAAGATVFAVVMAIVAASARPVPFE